jgi:hypothetical protein
MPEEFPIEDAPRDRDIMLHGGGWITPEGEAVFGPAIAQLQIGYWIMRGTPSRGGYINPSRWSEIVL